MSKAHDVKRRRVDADGSRTESPDAGKPTDRQASHSAAASVAETEPWGPGCMLLGVIAVGTLTLLVTFALYRQQELGYSRSEEKATDVDDSVGADGHAKPLFPVYATDQLFTRDELSSHGSSSKRIHLAILGRVYDVTKGRKYYGPKGGYAFFAGRDATRSFVSGDFSDAGLTDDLEGLSIREYLGIADWVGTYEKEYKYVGRLIGRFYDGDGRPTDSLLDAENKIRLAGEMKSKEDDMKKLFPPCNSRWAAGKGEVWCSNKRYPSQRQSDVSYPNTLGPDPVHNSECFG